jgi:hypothetical protein
MTHEESGRAKLRLEFPVLEHLFFAVQCAGAPFPAGYLRKFARDIFDRVDGFLAVSKINRSVKIYLVIRCSHDDDLSRYQELVHRLRSERTQ